MILVLDINAASVILFKCWEEGLTTPLLTSGMSLLSVIGEVKNAYNGFKSKLDEDDGILQRRVLEEERAPSFGLSNDELTEKYLVPSATFSKDWLDYFQE